MSYAAIAGTAASTVATTKIVTQAQAMSPDAAAIARHAKLKQASEKFEGIMLEEMLKPMQHAGSVTGGGSDDGSDDPDADPALSGYSSYGIEAMAEAMAKSGGLGIAKVVLRQLEGRNGSSDEKS